MIYLTASDFLVLASGLGLLILLVAYTQTDKEDKEQKRTLKIYASVLIIIYIATMFFTG